jgi:multidrug efflux pump subunit AcrA (membrane-fusion protein)
VTVSYPVERDVSDYVDFTGRTSAVDSVEVRSRIWGYLDKVNFKEGAIVEKGEVLFEIDPLVYQAAVRQAEGNLAAAEARALALKSVSADAVGVGAVFVSAGYADEEPDWQSRDGYLFFHHLPLPVVPAAH